MCSASQEHLSGRSFPGNIVPRRGLRPVHDTGDQPDNRSDQCLTTELELLHACCCPCRRYVSLRRAMEGLIASDRMSVFSTKRDEAFSRETGGCKGEEVCGLSGQSQSGHSAASIVPKKEAFTSAPCSPSSSETGPELYGTMDASGLSRVGDGRTEQSESTGEEKTPNVSATFPSRYYLATTEPNGEDDASSDIDVVNGGKDCGFSLSGMGVETHEAMLMMPEELSDGAIGEMEDQEIAPADWLDVTYAMLDAVNESGQACL